MIPNVTWTRFGGLPLAVAGLATPVPLACGGEAVSEFVQTRFVTKDHITAPTGISVSPEGVAFVSCDINATTRTRRGVGKVVRCEDTDGDGVADRFSNFIEGIDSPRGSCYVDGTLYLMQPPSLVAYKDIDRDGVAEEKTVLVTGLGQPLVHLAAYHSANGACMGIDGWLYLAIGDQGCFEATGTDGCQASLRGGGVLRVRPDGSQLGFLLTGTRNLYDLAVDPYLGLFARDNTNDGGGWGARIHHLIELADLGYPSLYKNFGNEHLPPLVDAGAGAGTAMLYVHEPGLPVGFGDTLFSGDFNTGVSRHPRRRHGESFQIRQEPFLNLSKSTGLDVDGRSRIYHTSWTGGGFGFASEAYGHVDIVQFADGAGQTEYPEIDGASDDELLSHLANRSQVARIHAMREMVTRGRSAMFSGGLTELAEDGGAPLYARVAAVMTLKQLDGKKAHGALRGLYPDDDLREFVVRALGDVAGEIESADQKLFIKALGDTDPRVRLRAIIALARSGDATVAEAILPLAKDEKMIVEGGGSLDEEPEPGDWSPPVRAISHVALKALVKLGAAELMLGNLDDVERRESALRGLQQMHSEDVVRGLAAKVATTGDKELVKLITLALFRLYHREATWDGMTWWGNRPNFAGPYYDPVTWEQTPAVRVAIEGAFRQADPDDYAFLFRMMRLNGVPEGELSLDIAFDEVLSFLNRPTLSDGEHARVMRAVADRGRPEEERLAIYGYFKRKPLPESYIHRVHILRAWGEGEAEGQRQRAAYKEFVSGAEFVGKLEQLERFYKASEKESYKYAHLQLLNLIDNPSVPQATRDAAKGELEKTWADQKNIYPHRLRGLMLAFEEVDPSPYAKQLRPLVEHRDERVKQPAARFLKAIDGAK